MKILYASSLSPGSTAAMRLRALERLGHTLIPLNTDEYESQNKFLHKITFRLVVGSGVQRLNRDLLRLAEEHRPDVFWADKVLSLQPRTLRKLTSQGIASVSYMIDNAFGPRRDPGWRLYLKTIPFFHLHCTQRSVTVKELGARGARDVIKIQTAYDEAMHFPPPPGWSDSDRTRDVSFIGTPYDNRPDFLRKLNAAGLRVSISGSLRSWRRTLSPEEQVKMLTSGALADASYREAIWRSKINLSFLTHGNQDEYTHKSFEIAGCGGFLLAERCEGHTSRFLEGEEAAFFSSAEECLAMIERYLPDEPLRTRIAAAGRRRAERDGYRHEHQLSLILHQLQSTCLQGEA